MGKNWNGIGKKKRKGNVSEVVCVDFDGSLEMKIVFVISWGVKEGKNGGERKGMREKIVKGFSGWGKG